MTAALALSAPAAGRTNPFAAEPRFAATGLLFLLSLAVTLAAATIDPRLFQGDDIWLKPIKFQIALAIYFLTLAFFARWLPAGMTERRSWRIYAGLVAFATIAEMLWIGGAAMAGTASHYNQTTPLMRRSTRWRASSRCSSPARPSSWASRSGATPRPACRPRSGSPSASAWC